MQKLILILITLVLTSLYYFPIAFSFFPALNSKNLMAGFGLLLGSLLIARRNNSVLNKDFFVLTIWAVLVSLAGLFSVAYNETPDYTYATYFVSMFIWVSAAFVLVYWIRLVHGTVSVVLVCNYLIAVCVGQCILALMIDSMPAFKGWVDSFVADFGFGNADDIEGKDRLYGIGAALDVAGTRFSAVLIMLAYILSKVEETKQKFYLLIYIVAFFFIAIVGNFMSRTTTIGVILALIYLFWVNRTRLFGINRDKKLWRFIFVIFVVAVLVTTYFYHHSPMFKENFRFAFEGFFNWFEKGRWETNSTNVLKKMFLWPDNMKTWLIGDGYFHGPSETDPYYVGPANPGFYKWTDVGYLRFIYYFGLMGTTLLIGYFIHAAFTCMNRFPNQKLIFLFLLFLNFAIWFKVATDIFIVFAIFLCINKEENDKALL